MSRAQKAKKGASDRKRGSGWVLLGVIVVGVALVGLAFWMQQNPPESPRPGPQTATAEAASTGTVPATNGLERLTGRWVRPDGGYVIEIRSVDDHGKLDAGYFNPSPIHVAKAEASREGSAVMVFIELQDVNYPGSTYTLSYDAANDQLHGIYYQAALQQRYEVDFERIK